MSWYAVVNAAGNVVKSFNVSNPADVAPNTPQGMTAVSSNGPQSQGKKYANGVFSDVTVTETPAEALARYLDTVDDEREMLMMGLLTAGGAKKYEYANKAREVRDYRTLSATVLANLLIAANIASTRERFAWAMSESDETGDSLATVIARYETAMTTTQLVRKYAARAQKLRRALRAAASPAAAKAIFDNRSWPTS